MFYLSSTFKKIFYGLAIFLLVVFLFWEDEKKTPIKFVTLPVGSAVYYMQIASNGLFSGVEEIWDRYIDLIRVEEENEQLRELVETLKTENNTLKEKGILADRLKIMLDYIEHSEVDMISAAVIGRKPSQWYDTIIINKGSLDGVTIDMGVLSSDGVVGKIINTGPRYAQVLLISDRNSAIGAVVQRTRDEGIAQGVDDNTIQLKYLPHDATVAVGDILITSGMEGSFAKGLTVGQVEEVERRKGEMFLKISARIGSDLRNIEEVFVIKSIQNEPGDILRKNMPSAGN